MCAGGVLWERQWPDASPNALRDRAAFVEALRRHAGFEVDEDAARVIFTELVTNAIKYGKRPVSARLECAHAKLRFCVQDHGHGFHDAPSVPEPLRPGGRGLFLVAEYAEELEIDGEPRGTLVMATIPKKKTH